MTQSKWKRPFIGTSSAAGLVLVVSLLIGAFGYQTSQSSSAPTPTPTTSASTGNGTPAPTCAPEFKQVAGNNASNRVDADFEAKYAKATADAAAAGTSLSDAQKKLILDNSADNGLRLAAWASAFGLYDTPTKWQPLVAKDCLSQEGQELYYQMKGVFNAKGTTFAEGEAPVNGYNSGVSDGTYGVNADQGISGDRKAIKVTLADGTVVWIMVRCGNVVYPGPPPGIPTVPTDQCPPGQTGTPPNCVTPPPPPACPPGQTGTPPNCITPKGGYIDNGWSPGQIGGDDPLTDGHVSSDQQASGQTSGNVTDNSVPSGTTSGSTTPDLPTGTVTAPDATPGGDDHSDDVTDPTTTTHDDGGTSGATCITDPFTGESNC